jgi:YVTN family beta-propeller protein
MKLSWASLVVGVVSVAACSSNTSGPSARPAAVVLSPANPWVKSGTSLQLSATVLDSNGAAIAGRPVTFLSSDASIIAVTTGGLATAVGPLGRAAVLARTVFGRDTVTGSTVVGAFDPSITARMSLPDRAYSVAVSPTNIVYVTQPDLNQLDRLSLPTLKVVDSVAVGIVPTEITFNSAGTRLYVTNQFSDNVGVIDVATNTVTSGVSIHGNPFAVVVAPGDTIVYVTSTLDSLFGIRATDASIAVRLQLPHISNGFAIHDTLLYVSTRDVGIVTVLNLKTNTFVDTIPIGGGPQGIVVSPDGKELYVANENATLQFWNIAGDSLDGSVALAGRGFGLARNPTTGKLYVTTLEGGQVHVVDPLTRAIVKSYPVTGVVRRIAFTSSGDLAVVANEAGWVDLIQ